MVISYGEGGKGIHGMNFTTEYDISRQCAGQKNYAASLPVTAHVICHQKICTNEHEPIHIGEKIESVMVLSTYHSIMKSIAIYKEA